MCYYFYFFIKANKGEETGVYYIDSTSIKVCHIKREKQNKVFKKIATKSKTSKEWFYGFKLHLITNEKGEIISFYFFSGSSFFRAHFSSTSVLFGITHSKIPYIKYY